MLQQTVMILSYVNLITLLIPIVIGLWQWPFLSPSLKIGWAAIAVYFVFFLLSILLTYTDINPLLVNYGVSASFGGIFAVAYWLAVPPGLRRWVIGILGVLGLTGILVETLVLGLHQDVSRWSVPLQTVLTTLTVLIYLHYVMPHTKRSLLQLPFFWVSIALLISSVLGTIYDALNYQLTDSSRDLLLIWLCFQLGVTIVCNGLYGVGFYRAKATMA